MRFLSALLLMAFSCSAVELVLPESEGRFNDEPSMARAADGSLYVAWNGFREGADALTIARYQFAGGSFRKLGFWEALAGRGTYILTPKVVATDSGRLRDLLCRTRARLGIVALPCSAKGPGTPVTIVADGASNLKPDGGWHANRGGGRGIRLAGLRGGRGLPVEDVSTGASNYGPSLALESNGNVAVAWHSFRENNYDIYLRRRSAAGEWTPERRITSAPTMDRHAALAVHKDDLWVFYENSQFRGYWTGMSQERKVIGAKVTPRGLESPRTFDQVPGYRRGEAASPIFDESGRLWLAYLTPKQPNEGWEVWFTGLKNWKCA